MCTLTLIAPHPAQLTANDASPILRLVMNRDELRTRPRALAPSMHTVGARSILMPLDPASQGTWIGINDRGIFAALLNLTEPDHLASPPRAARSRGTIIPAILRHDTLEYARSAAQALLNDDFLPFRLFIGSLDGASLLHSRARTVEPLSLPLILTSSGLGDHLVHPPRSDLFASTLAQDLSPSSQDAFHRHIFPDQRHLSVLMDRADARTVSITTLELSRHTANMLYEDLLTRQCSVAHCPFTQSAVSPVELSNR